MQQPKISVYQPMGTGKILATILIHKNMNFIFYGQKHEIIKKYFELFKTNRDHNWEKKSPLLFLNLNKNMCSNSKTKQRHHSDTLWKGERSVKFRFLHVEIKQPADCIPLSLVMAQSRKGLGTLSTDTKNSIKIFSLTPKI